MFSKDNIFTILSLFFGIFGILSVTSIIIPIVFGSLAVIFAVLSKGGETKYTKKSIIGLFTGLTAVLCALGITVGTVYLVLFNEEYRARFNETYKETYGITFDEYYNELVNYYKTGEMPESIEPGIGLENNVNLNNQTR